MDETAVDLAFGDGTYRFWLPMPQVIELERICETSLLSLHQRMETSLALDAEGKYHYLDGGGPGTLAIREIIRLALIGGNNGLVNDTEIEVGPNRAKELVNLYAYPARPLGESAAVAGAILMAAVRGVRLKKKAEPAAKPSRKRSAKAR